MSNETIQRIASLGEVVVGRAVKLEVKHGPFASAHEAHSVIREELEELFDEVRKKREMRSPLALRNEAMDIAAAALRFAAEVDPMPLVTLEGDERWAKRVQLLEERNRRAAAVLRGEDDR